MPPERFAFASPQWMTHALRGGGCLTSGSVTEAALSAFTTPVIIQKVVRVRLTYSRGAGGSLPSSAVLKVANSSKEHAFFNTIQPVMKDPAVVAVFHSEYDPATDCSRMLMEDLSASHWQSEHPLPPPLEQCLESLEVLARIHAYWWQHRSLESDLRPALVTHYSWQGRIHTALEQLPRFLTFIGDRLSSPRRQLLRRLADAPDAPWLPGNTGHPTLLHGDAHFWNFLYPKDHRAGGPRLIDWNPWDIGRASDDLAYMLALHWYPERRRAYETRLLRHYHERLLGFGVRGYNFEDLQQDYRLSAVMNLLIPVWQWQRGIPAGIWWSHLERAFLAFADLDCNNLVS